MGATVIVGLSSCASPDQDLGKRLVVLRQEAEERRALAAVEAAERREEAQRTEERRITELAKFFARNRQLSEVDRQSLSDRKPIVGLTFDEAFLFVGGLVKITESGGVGGNWSVWKTFRAYPMYELYFRDGRLVRWIEL